MAPNTASPPQNGGVSAPFPETEPSDHLAKLANADRLRALAATNIMGSLPETAYDRITRHATQLMGAPVSLMSMVTPEEQFFKSTHGLPEALADVRSTPLNQSLCQYVVTQGKGLAVHDARTHPLLKNSGAVSDLGVIAYLGEPIHSPDGLVLGSLCAIDDKPHVWSREDQVTMRDLADMVESELRLRLTAQRNDLLLKEMNHRVKNMFTLTGSLVRQSARLTEDKDTLVEALLGRLMALSASHEVALGDPSVLADRATRLGDLIEVALAPYHHDAGNHITAEGPDIILDPTSITYIALSLHELATNAAKYGALSENGGTLDVRWEKAATGARLIWDETTPIADPDSATGFGTEMLDDAVMFGLGGAIERVATSKGIRYEIELPVSALV